MPGLTPDNLFWWIVILAALLVHRVVRFIATELENANARRQLLSRVQHLRADYQRRLTELGIAEPPNLDGFDVDVIDRSDAA